LFFQTEDEDMDGNVSDLASASQAEVLLSGNSSSWRSLRKETNRTMVIVSKYYICLLNTAVQQWRESVCICQYVYCSRIRTSPKGKGSVLPKTY